MIENKDIPLEAVLKYIVRDRDRYKSQLDNLIGYTKALEIRVQEMTAEMNIAREEYAKNIEKARKQAENESKKVDITKKKKKIRGMLAQIHEFAKQIEKQLEDKE